MTTAFDSARSSLAPGVPCIALNALTAFDGVRINLFMLRFCQPVSSAALIARVEMLTAGEAR